MDHNNILILDNGCEKVVYKKLYNVWSDYQEMSKLQLSTWEENGVDVFYLHNSSKSEIVKQTFPVSIMADIVNIIKHKYNDELEDRDLTYHQRLLDVQNHLPSLYMTAVGIAKGKYLNLICDYDEKDIFILSEFSVAEVHNEDQIKDVHRQVMCKLLPNVSHVIYTFLYKYRDEVEESDETIMLHFIEAMTLNRYIDQLDTQFRHYESRDEYMDLLLNDIKNVFEDLKICEENIGCIIYMDDTTVLEESKHVFKFFESLIKLPQSIKRKPEVTALLPSTSNSYNELKKHNSKLKMAALMLEKKYNNLLKLSYQDKEKLKSTISKQVLSKLSASRNELLQKHRAQYERMLFECKSNYEKKVKDLSDYYDVLLKDIQDQLNHRNTEFSNLHTEKQQLENKVAVMQENLNTIQTFVLGGQLKSTSETIMNLDIKNENLNSEVKHKEKIIENLMFQLKYYKDIKADEDKIKLVLEAEKTDMIRHIESIQARHTEQFNNYEKLLQKSRQEIKMHKREVIRLRQHINSDNFPPSPAVARLVNDSISTAKSAKTEKNCQTNMGPTTPALLKLNNLGTHNSDCVYTKCLRSATFLPCTVTHDKENKSPNVLEFDSPESSVSPKNKSMKSPHSTISKSTSSKIQESFSTNETSVSSQDKNISLVASKEIGKLPEKSKEAKGSTESISKTVPGIEETPRKRLRGRPKKSKEAKGSPETTSKTVPDIEETPRKRLRDRPKKSKEAKGSPESTSKTVSGIKETPRKRPRGRPKKRSF